MDSKDQKTSWDSLLENLGAQPDAEAFERRQPPATEIAPTLAEAEIDEKAPAVAPGDWNSLANELGIEVPSQVDPDAELQDRDSESAGSESASGGLEPADIPESIGGEISEDELIVSDSFGSELETSLARDSLSGAGGAESLLAEEVEGEDSAETTQEESGSSDDANPLVGDESQDQIVGHDQSVGQDRAWDQFTSTNKTNDIDQALGDQQQSISQAENSEEDKGEQKKKGFGISGEAARSAFDAIFSAGAAAWGSAIRGESPFSKEPRELVFSDEMETSSEDLLPGEELTEGDAAEEEEIPRAKRKRSRRRRGGRGRKQAEDKVSAEEQGESSDSKSQDEEGLEDSLDTGDKKPRRRRSRRRSRSGESGDAKGSRPKGRETDDVRADDNEEFLDSQLGGEDLDDQDNPNSSADRPRTYHRNLPTWSDAIGVIVDANLVLHSKAPNKSNSSRNQGGRNQGGRGRGGRGGRGRGGSKKS